MNSNQTNIEVLNDLIKINNDRIIEYKKAIDQLSYNDHDLRTVFTTMFEQSSKHKLFLHLLSEENEKLYKWV